MGQLRQPVRLLSSLSTRFPAAFYWAQIHAFGHVLVQAWPFCGRDSRACPQELPVWEGEGREGEEEEGEEP